MSGRPGLFGVLEPGSGSATSAVKRWATPTDLLGPKESLLLEKSLRLGSGQPSSFTAHRRGLSPLARPTGPVTVRVTGSGPVKSKDGRYFFREENFLLNIKCD